MQRDLGGGVLTRRFGALRCIWWRGCGVLCGRRWPESFTVVPPAGGLRRSWSFCSTSQANKDQNLSVRCAGTRGDERHWLENEGRRELTGIIVGDRRCLRDRDLDCEQPGGATSRVLGGRHARRSYRRDFIAKG
jgi:hypothetical protein